MRLWLLLTPLLSLISSVHCARILAVLPLPSKSHGVLQHTIFRLLAQRGHQVVVYSAVPPPRHTDNITHISLHNSLVDMTTNWDIEEFLRFTDTQYFFQFGVKNTWDVCLDICKSVFEDENIKELLQSKESFDLIFLEPTIGQESLLVFGHRFKAPVINFQGFSSWSISNWVVGNPLSISHIPENLNFAFTDKMTFVERLANFVSTVMTIFYYHMEYLPKHQQMIDQYYKDPSTPPIEDMLRNISITLINVFPTLEYPKPYTPNIIPIGGAHMSAHMTPLPQNIKKFMDDAKEGVIFFSLGTLVPAHAFPDEYIQAFVKTFAKLSQKVLWKIALDDVPGLPKNVVLTKWVSQPTVLAHRNCILFMTHGGLFSQHEALYAGVPVIGIPFFFDQRYNVKFYEYLGMGVKLEFKAITEESVTKAVNTVLSNPRYSENAQKMSRIIRDQPISLTESVVFWVEYVLRHHGAHHLRPVSAELPWYQLTLLDVLAAILVVVIMVSIIFYKITKKLLNILFTRKNSNVSNNKKTD